MGTLDVQSIFDEWATSLRLAQRRRRYSIAVIVTTAIGFSVAAGGAGLVRQMIFRPVGGLTSAGRVSVLSGRLDSTAAPSFPTRHFWTAGEIRQLQEVDHSAVSVLAYAPATAMPSLIGTESRELRVTLVGPEFCSVLQPVLVEGNCVIGRDDSGWASEAVALIAFDAWRRDYGGDSTVVGKFISLEGTPHRIIGVAAPSFSGLETIVPDFWAAVAPSRWQSEERRAWLLGSGSFSFLALARSRVGDLDRMWLARAGATLARSDSDLRRKHRVIAVSTQSVADYRLAALGNRSPALMLLGGIAIAVLCMTAVNVAFIALGRWIQDRGERAIRAALGATTERLLLGNVFELTALVGTGLVVGLAGASIAANVAGRALLGERWQPHMVPAADIAAYAILAAVVVLVTAVTLVAEGLRREANSPQIVTLRSTTPERRVGSWRRGLLAAQIAICVPLLLAAILFTTSLRAIHALDLGYQPDGLVAISLSRAVGSAWHGDLRNIAEQILDRVRIDTRVSESGVASSLPLTNADMVVVAVPGRDSFPRAPGGGPDITVLGASAFRALRLRVVLGRPIQSSDSVGPPVVVVNETMARLVWGTQPLLGTCLDVGPPPLVCHQIVGVVRDARRFELLGQPAMQYYVPLQNSRITLSRAHVIVRAKSQRVARQLAGELAREVAAWIPAGVVPRIELVTARIDRQTATWRSGATILPLVGGLTLAVAAAGLFGAIQLSALARRREFAIRQALGATRVEVISLLARETLYLIALALLLSIPPVAALRPFLDGLAVQTSLVTPTSVTTVLALLTSVGALGLLVPARWVSQSGLQIALSREER